MLPDAMFAIIIVIMNGEARRGPRSAMVWTLSAKAWMPPTPEPT